MTKAQATAGMSGAAVYKRHSTMRGDIVERAAKVSSAGLAVTSIVLIDA